MTEETKPVTPFDFFKADTGRVSDKVAKERLKICKKCPNFNKVTKQCGICHCIMPLKVKLPLATCPIEKWGVAPKA